jgi:long-chain acyl-CoA synthetase
MNEPEQRTPEYWAQTRPDAPAVIAGDEVLTYGEWNEQADRVAEGLAALGLEPADRVGMRFRLGIGWFVIQRASQKLGAEKRALVWKSR